MSSTGTALEKTKLSSRRELEEKFCSRLSDMALQIAVGSNFDALLLWKQRDAYIDELAKHGLSYGVIGTVIA